MEDLMFWFGSIIVIFSIFGCWRGSLPPGEGKEKRILNIALAIIMVAFIVCFAVNAVRLSDVAFICDTIFLFLVAWMVNFLCVSLARLFKEFKGG